METGSRSVHDWNGDVDISVLECAINKAEDAKNKKKEEAKKEVLQHKLLTTAANTALANEEAKLKRLKGTTEENGKEPKVEKKIGSEGEGEEEVEINKLNSELKET